MTGIATATLHTRIRQRVDANDTTFGSDTQLQEWCIDAYIERWDFVLGAMGQEAPLQRTQHVTVVNQDFVDLSVASGAFGSGTDATGAYQDVFSQDPYRLYRLEWDGAGLNRWAPLRRGNLQSDERVIGSRAWGGSPRYYATRTARVLFPASLGVAQHFYSWRIYFDTTPSAVYNLQLWSAAFPLFVWRTYASNPTVLQLYPDDGADYATEYAAARLAEKMEQDPTPFRVELERLKAQALQQLTPLDVGGPQLIADMRRHQEGTDFDPFWDRRR